MWSCHVSLTVIRPICDLLTSSFNLYHLRYGLFFTPPHCCYNLISFVLIRPPISTKSLQSKSFTHSMWAEQAAQFDCRLTKKDYYQINAFPDLVMVKQEEYPHLLQKKTTRGVPSEIVRRTADRMRPGLTLEMSISASIIHHIFWWVRVIVE